MLPDRVYRILKYVALVAFPAIATFYGALAGAWGFPEPEKVITTITALDTLLGALIGISTVRFNAAQTSDGTLMVDKSKQVFAELEPHVLNGREKVTLDVKHV